MEVMANNNLQFHLQIAFVLYVFYVWFVIKFVNNFVMTKK